MNQPIGDMVSNPNIYKCVFYCFLIAIVEMSVNILMCCVLFSVYSLTLSVVCNHSQMLSQENPATVIIRELSWIFSMSVCHVCFDLMRSRFLFFFFFFLPFFPLTRSFHNLVLFLFPFSSSSSSSPFAFS